MKPQRDIRALAELLTPEPGLMEALQVSTPSFPNYFLCNCQSAVLATAYLVYYSTGIAEVGQYSMGRILRIFLPDSSLRQMDPLMW